jgi:hypothetical protein
MPYRHAHWWLLALFPLTALAFWPNYFSDLRGAPVAFHVHGITASLWIGLLAFQSWSIHQRRNALHRTLGVASFGLFPLFMVGGLLVIQTMSVKTAAGLDPFMAEYGPRLALIDIVSTVGIFYLFYMALKCRRKVHPHARYMLGTVFFLISPILGRLLPALPPLAIEGPQHLHRFGYSVHIGNAVAFGFLVALCLRAPKHARPLAVVAGLIALQSVLFETVGRTALWQSIFPRIGDLPTSLIVSIGLAAGAAVTWAGWASGTPVRRPAAAA